MKGIHREKKSSNTVIQRKKKIKLPVATNEVVQQQLVRANPMWFIFRELIKGHTSNSKSATFISILSSSAKMYQYSKISFSKPTLLSNYCLSSAPLMLSENVKILTFRYSPYETVQIHHSNSPTDIRKGSSVFS